MKTETWRLLPLEVLAANAQFARSEAMLAHAVTPALRWYQIKPEALALGRGQTAEVVDWHACHIGGHRVFRRATGGGAVLTGLDILSLDVVLPSAHPLALHDVTRSYEWLGRALAEGLRSTAVAAETIAPERARAQATSTSEDDPARLACYAMLSPHEVLVDGRKIVGLAQARRRRGALLQAGVLLHWRPERLLRLLHLLPDERAQAALALEQRCVGMNELRESIELSELTQILTRAVCATARAEVRATGWTTPEQTTFAEAMAQFPSLEEPATDAPNRDRDGA